MVKNLRVKVLHHTARAQGFERSSCAKGRCLFLGRVREKIELYSMHLGKFKEGTRIIGIALTVGELIGALRRPVPWLRCPPVFFYLLRQYLVRCPVSPQSPQVGGCFGTKFLHSKGLCGPCPDSPQLLHFKAASADLFSSMTVATDFVGAIRMASACWAATAIRFVNFF